jgi:hypothetical protein
MAGAPPRRRVLAPTVLMTAMTLNVAPLLMGFDRGNYIVICIPLLYFFYIGIMDSRTRLSLLMGLLLVLLKPQMILLGFIFFADREWRMGLKWLGTTLGGTALAFALYPPDVYRNISDFVKQLSSDQQYAQQGGIYPVNVTFSNTLSIISSFLFKRVFHGPTITIISLFLCAAIYSMGYSMVPSSLESSRFTRSSSRGKLDDRTGRVRNIIRINSFRRCEVQVNLFGAATVQIVG